MNHYYPLLYKNTLSGRKYKKLLQKQAFSFSIPEVCACFCSGICSSVVVIFPAVDMFCLSFTVNCVLFSIAGCIPVSLSVGLPVIIKG
jgi:hypothetical protein